MQIVTKTARAALSVVGEVVRGHSPGLVVQTVKTQVCCQCDAVCCCSAGVLPLQCFAVCCSVLQCAAVCCSVLQCVVAGPCCADG